MGEQAIAATWEGPTQCEHCGIRHLVLFSSLESHEFALIHDPIVEVTFGKGRRLYREGESSSHLFTVREGVVKLFHYLPDGSERIVRLLSKGDVAGLETLLGRPYQHHAVAIDPVLSCRIPVHTVERLGRELPHFHRQLLGRWQQAVGDADTWLTELATGSAKSRVARLLLRLAARDSDAMCFLPTREDMGAMMGVSTETVSRITAEFSRDGLLSKVAKNRASIERYALQNIAGES